MSPGNPICTQHNEHKMDIPSNPTTRRKLQRRRTQEINRSDIILARKRYFSEDLSEVNHSQFIEQLNECSKEIEKEEFEEVDNTHSTVIFRERNNRRTCNTTTEDRRNGRHMTNQDFNSDNYIRGDAQQNTSEQNSWRSFKLPPRNSLLNLERPVLRSYPAITSLPNLNEKESIDVNEQFSDENLYEEILFVGSEKEQEADGKSTEHHYENLSFANYFKTVVNSLSGNDMKKENKTDVSERTLQTEKEKNETSKMNNILGKESTELPKQLSDLDKKPRLKPTSISTQSSVKNPWIESIPEPRHIIRERQGAHPDINKCIKGQKHIENYVSNEDFILKGFTILSQKKSGVKNDYNEDITVTASTSAATASYRFNKGGIKYGSVIILTLNHPLKVSKRDNVTFAFVFNREGLYSKYKFIHPIQENEKLLCPKRDVSGFLLELITTEG